MNALNGKSKKHQRYGIEVAADRYFSVNGPAMNRLPTWGAVRRPDGLEVHLHPPISYEVHYRVPFWMMIFAFNSAETRGAFDDDPLAIGQRARGNACLVPPDTRVRVIQEAPQEFLAVGISPERLASIADTAAGRDGWRAARVHSDGDAALAALCGELRRVMIGEPTASASYLSAIVEATATRLIGNGLLIDDDDGRSAEGRETLSPSVRRRVIAEIENRLGDKITVGALAESVGLSRSHFTRAFSASFGESPARYLLERRIARAREMLLETARPVTEIALSCGFADHAHFSTAFRKEVGLAPSAYRKTATERD